MASLYRRYGKRWFDVVAAALLIIVACPLIVAVAAAVRVRLGAPVIFFQRRGGYRGAPLDMAKFRSMTDERGADGGLLPDAQRLCGFGAALRAWSLDELPQFWHVLRGEMSLVGPRPFVIDYMDKYTPEEMRRHDVRPGMTGLAQVMGRNGLTWDQKFKHDLDYVDRVSLTLDLWILWRTIGVLLGRGGVSATGHATMPVWQGHQAAHGGGDRSRPLAANTATMPARGAAVARQAGIGHS